ncbi:MAG: response regulator [Alphaproteobacteria bacterium]|nr:MAG: response regulator [Alphaproteobacteria bacterium]
MVLKNSNYHTVLLVDDDKDIIELFKENLEGLSFDVHTAHNGIEALEFLEKNKVDCIVTDISMPEMNGLEFIEHLQARLDFTPFFFITGYTDYPREKLNTYRPCAVIFKPFDFEEISTLVKMHLMKNS